MVEKDKQNKMRSFSPIKPIRRREPEVVQKSNSETKSKTFPNPKPFKLDDPDGSQRDVFVHGVDAQKMIATISENKRPPFQQISITFFELNELLHL